MEETKDLAKYDEKTYNVLVREEDLRASPLLKVELTVVRIDPRDVREGGETHNIGGQLSPSRSALDKIADACGITFDEALCNTERIAKDLWKAKAVGRRKNPDGTWRTQSAEYELDVDVRTEEVRKRQKSKDSGDAEILQLRKFGCQRADTGARLRVIRALTGLKTGFTPAELQKPFVFARYSLNVQMMLDDPDMKQVLLRQAVGAKEEIFGPATVRDVTPEKEALPEPEATGEAGGAQGEATEPVDDDPFDERKAQELSPEEQSRIELEEWLNSDILKDSAKELIRSTLKDEKATLQGLQDLVKRCKQYEERKLKGAAK